MKKQIGVAVLGSLSAALPVFALGGDSATMAQLQAENAAITAGNLSVNPLAERTQLVKALGYDMGQISNYMVPINGDVANFAAKANALAQSLSQ
ncbi:hypothetical protein HF563_04585 [Acidithiobacillus ferridurans]|nr:hypothetical protein [Acidithiobacillus ferridurans]